MKTEIKFNLNRRPGKIIGGMIESAARKLNHSGEIIGGMAESAARKLEKMSEKGVPDRILFTVTLLSLAAAVAAVLMELYTLVWISILVCIVSAIAGILRDGNRNDNV